MVLAGGLASVSLVLVSGSPAAGASYRITTPDASGSPGSHASIQLDASGNPVVAYRAAVGELRVLRCDDPTCSPGGDTIEVPIGSADPGNGISMQLDASGNPVIAYHDRTADRLRVLHCDDPACAPGGDSLTGPDATTGAGEFVSMQLDAIGRPVVSYYDGSALTLSVLHCNDPNCAGHDDSVTNPDPDTIVGQYTSLELDAGGFPVVAYQDASSQDVKILRCDDPDCAGGDETITSPATVGNVGRFTSLELGQSDHPVVSYLDVTANGLRLLRCDDPACDGTNETIEVPDPAVRVGGYSSLRLDSAGNPVIAYQDYLAFDMHVVRCNDPACAGGDELVAEVDTAGNVGEWTSLALDAGGNPVVAYRSETAQALRLARLGEFGVPVPSCVAGWWRGDGDLAAEIGPALTGTTSFAPGLVGQGFDLELGDKLVITGGFPSLADEISVDMWIRPGQTGSIQTLMSRWDFPSTDDGARTFVLRLHPYHGLEWSTDEVSTRRPSVLRAPAPSVFDGQFHHVAATWSQSEMSLYFDGVSVATAPSRGGSLNPASDVDFRLGSEGGDRTRSPFTGLIDDAAIYSCAITPAEVEAIFLAGSDGKS